MVCCNTTIGKVAPRVGAWIETKPVLNGRQSNPRG